jgi:hypothetical protein
MKSSSVRCFKVVVENLCTPYVVGVDVEPVENLTQDEELQGVVVREVDMSCEPGALNDEFDEEALMVMMTMEMESMICMTYPKDRRMTKLVLPQRTKMT